MRISPKRKSSERVPSGEKRKKDVREVSEAGIVKKNAIMKADFALQAERKLNLSSEEAIFQACLVRFRPITMTTFATMLGALPLAFAFGEGSEIRRPLGVSIVGGLIVSQLLTLYSTPVSFSSHP